MSKLKKRLQEKVNEKTAKLESRPESIKVVTENELIASGFFEVDKETDLLIRFIRNLVKGKANIIVTSPVGVDKSNLLDVFLYEYNRQSINPVTYFADSEPKINGENFVRLSGTLKENIQQAAAEQPGSLFVKNGEKEFVELLDAMLLGVPVIATLNAHNIMKAIVRMEQLIIRTCGGMSLEAAKKLLHECVDMIIHVEETDGIIHIAEMTHLLVGRHVEKSRLINIVQTSRQGDCRLHNFARGKRQEYASRDLLVKLCRNKVATDELYTITESSSFTDNFNITKNLV
ncbi:MAG: ATPase, T2SS/T4P/T4SS family [Dethiobacteraceae bacterium]|jgi:type IV secretory pathway ATPase VirB11/archaellum biosynthesis ATPase